MSTLPCYLDLCMQLYRYRRQLAEFDLNIFDLDTQIFLFGDLNIFYLYNFTYMFPLVCADCPLYYDLCMQLYTRQLADFLAQPPVSRQPSPRQGRLESSSVALSAGEELDTVSQ